MKQRSFAESACDFPTHRHGPPRNKTRWTGWSRRRARKVTTAASSAWKQGVRTSMARRYAGFSDGTSESLR
jgi:hypothetical protein